MNARLEKLAAEAKAKKKQETNAAFSAAINSSAEHLENFLAAQAEAQAIYAEADRSTRRWTTDAEDLMDIRKNYQAFKQLGQKIGIGAAIRNVLRDRV